MPKQLLVQFTPIRSCLVNLPGQWVSALLDQRKLPQNVILDISWTGKEGKKKTFCGWSGEASKPLPPNAVFTHGQNSKLEVLEMDPQVGQAIGLAEGQKVNVEFCRNVPDCASVHVEPHTEDDWEILELHAGYVEENLLGQIRAVYNNQLMCVWIHGRTLVRLRVAELDPKVPVVKLNTNSEVIVAPKVRKQPKPASEVAASLQKQQKAAPHIYLRNLPLAVDIESKAEIMIHPDSVSDVKGSELVCVAKVQPGFIRQKSSEENKDQENEVNGSDTVAIAKEIYAPLALSSAVPRNHVYVAESIRNTLEIKDFDIVKIATVAIKSSPLGSIVLRQQVSSAATNHSSLRLGLDSAAQAQQKNERNTALIQSFRDWLERNPNDKVVLTQGSIYTTTMGSEERISTIIQFGQKKGLFSGLNGNAPPPSESISEYVVVSKSQIKGMQIEVGEDVVKYGAEESKSGGSEPPAAMGGVNKLYEKIHQYTVANVADKDLKQALSVPGCGGILVTGAHGAGKTSLVKKLITSLHCDPKALIYTREVNCAEVAEERVPTFKELLQQWFDEAAWHAPSLIFFDDVDRLIPAEVEHADSTRSRHLAELFLRTANKMTKRHQIMIIATSQQQQSLHPALIGNHVFTELRHLNPPSRDERKEVILCMRKASDETNVPKKNQIMETIMSNGPELLQKSLPNIDLVSVASETEGYLAADLKALIERTVHEGAVRSIKEKTDKPTEKVELQLTQEDFKKAREDFVPSSLRGVKLQSSGVQWSDIGGLNETRKALLETLEWPTKYQAVFSQCPLRLRSGLLLYGYPGCGKTLLASAVAKECGLNFISVKGPEILNKYIGASEKSVRDLFERAQAAKPCVLFFDEFDSIAPRRGHDSTGVTDRVVNQMLTQMDGAEGLDGVYVLAATSRPDLIDPALLRPGRLDKALLCGMPSFDERLEILQALSQKMTLAAEVDLRLFAEKTEGYSGADLQGFLYNAHLEAIHGSVNLESFKEAQKKEQEGKKQADEKSDFVMVRSEKTTTGAPLTLAEKGQISQRLALIKKGVAGSRKKPTDKATPVAATTGHAAITNAYLDKSLKSTRPSITAEEYLRLSMIYNEFVTGRTGELPSGEGAKGIGKRSTLG
ncbi:P-loop containing nucleoside triphosphate hydrolase protein [Fennellomyces sp. T-0311]|nr:P-loop containing nucleoside triphosphate hydrolase protein [Fennellomyces sp. T-0311]